MVFVLAAGACVSDDLPPSIWPPADFRLVVEQRDVAGGTVHVTRRLVVGPDGVATYGVSSAPLVDPASGLSLPVFDRLAIYALVPICLRALARRLDPLVEQAAVDEGSATASLAADGGYHLTWRAFGRSFVLAVPKRVRGLQAEIMTVVSAHLPPDESFDVALNRPVVGVLRGVPPPRTDAAGALGAYDELLADGAVADDLLLDAFALACRLGRRDAAERWLARWSEATADDRAEVSPFAEQQTRLEPEQLVAFLPPG
jgi:hypothetical protein